LLFDKLFPNQPTPAEDNSNRLEIIEILRQEEQAEALRAKSTK
jgi:hypothetical protein